MKFLGFRLKTLIAITALAAAPGCVGPADPGDFVSDNPNAPDGGGDGGLTGGSGEGTDSGGEDPGGDDGGGEQEILEADIVAIEGDRLYALSRFGGLSVIDVSTRDQLPVLGRYRAHAEPFEMYVDAGQVFVMFSSYGSYGWDEELGSYTWQESSKLVALDATDPANIQVRGEFDLPGRIQDSRRIADVLYLVTYQNGYCWGCTTTPNTTVTSLDVSDEAKPFVVDQLTFEDDETEYGWGGARSVSSTTERMYVAGTEWTDWDSANSTIDVVDISDPGGQLVAGTSVPVAGQINSRWQMDEHEGVLRVVSQPGFWGSTNPPVIQTFSVSSADDISPLGSTQMTLPRPESLRAVRFDGTRGYAITFEQTDPLFTLDLSDASAPKQVGELEIPGWVYHMEPRGDQIVALGFDRDHPDGSINVSLFDVSVFDQPQMTSRVHFGGDWADFGEDQDRIHKAFNILDELGMILVPYSGWDYEAENYCHGSYKGGVQIIDWAGDTLTTRGVADAKGRPRRALLHDERLLAVSDKAVQSFDIDDRDAPTETAFLALAANVSRVVQAGSKVVRLSLDWWTNETSLEIANPADLEDPHPLGSLNLAQYLEQSSGPECVGEDLYGADVFSHEGHVYLVYDHWEWDSGNESTRMMVFDVQDGQNPTYIDTIELMFSRGWGGGYLGGIDVGGERAVLHGDALVMAASSTEWTQNDEPVSHASYEVVDLSDPAAPKHAKSIQRPSALQHGILQVQDDRVLSWHMRKANPLGTKVRFFLDRLDVKDPSDAHAETPVNVPGVVAAYREDEGRATTVDFRTQRQKMAEEDCWALARAYTYDWETDECILISRDLKLVSVSDGQAALLDTLEVEGDEGALQRVAASDDRVFLHLREGNWYWYEETGPEEPPTNQLVVLEGEDGNALSEASRQDLEVPYLYLGTAVASGPRLTFTLDQGLAVFDASDAEAPELDVHETYGYGCYDLAVGAGRVLCAQGEWGLQVFDLD